MAFDTPDTATGRLGTRLLDTFEAGTMTVQPYLKVNVWHTFGGTGNVIFAPANAIPAKIATTYLDAGGGIVSQINPSVAAFATAS